MDDRPVPHTYLKKVRDLEREVKRARDAANGRTLKNLLQREFEAERKRLTERATYWRKRADTLLMERWEFLKALGYKRADVRGHCAECGAANENPCRTESDKLFSTRGVKRHHLRGRQGPCGSISCIPCRDHFRLKWVTAFDTQLATADPEISQP